MTLPGFRMEVPQFAKNDRHFDASATTFLILFSCDATAGANSTHFECMAWFLATLTRPGLPVARRFNHVPWLVPVLIADLFRRMHQCIDPLAHPVLLLFLLGSGHQTQSPWRMFDTRGKRVPAHAPRRLHRASHRCCARAFLTCRSLSASALVARMEPDCLTYGFLRRRHRLEAAGNTLSHV